MPFLSSKHNDAIENAISTRTFGVYYCEAQEHDLNIHMHNCCEVLLCLSGGNTFLIDGKIYHASNGDLFVINQFEPHKIIPGPDASFAHFALEIHPEYLSLNSTEKTDLSQCFYMRGDSISNKISLSDQEIAQMEQLFIFFRTKSTFGDDVLKNAAVNMMLAFVNQLFLKQTKKGVSSTIVDDTIHTALQYIEENYATELTLEKLAKHSYISVNQLCKLFKKQLGTTAAKYIMSKRISQAKKMLAQGKSVAETAVSCGFSDYANFIRVFKKTVGVSPGKYNKV